MPRRNKSRYPLSYTPEGEKIYPNHLSIWNQLDYSKRKGLEKEYQTYRLAGMKPPHSGSLLQRLGESLGVASPMKIGGPDQIRTPESVQREQAMHVQRQQLAQPGPAASTAGGIPPTPASYQPQSQLQQKMVAAGANLSPGVVAPSPPDDDPVPAPGSC